MKAIEIETRIEGGKFKKNNDFIKKAVSQFEGKEIKIIFKRKYKQRSENQNDFYWAVWIPILQREISEAWSQFLTPGDVHEILKFNCNYEEKINEETGAFARVPMSSTVLTTYEWEFEFKNRVKQFAMDLFNIDLPEPDTQLKLKF